MPIRILLVDDHALVRQGLRTLLESNSEFRVVAEAGSGIEAVRFAVEHQPDVAVMDIAMSGLNGIEATSQIRRLCPQMAVLVLSMHREERYVTRAVKAGARGYLLKDSVGEDLFKAVRAVHAGQSFCSPAVARTLLDAFARDLGARDLEDPLELLTEREREVYQLLSEGQTNKQIAVLLRLSLHTVETHRVRVMQKLGVHSIAELVLSAVRRGLIG